MSHKYKPDFLHLDSMMGFWGCAQLYSFMQENINHWDLGLFPIKPSYFCDTIFLWLAYIIVDDLRCSFPQKDNGLPTISLFLICECRSKWLIFFQNDFFAAAVSRNINGDAIQGDELSRRDGIASVSLITSRNEGDCGSPASVGRNRHRSTSYWVQ